MKTINKYILPLLFLAFLSSCIGDLDTYPDDGTTLVADELYSDKANYKGVLAKCYATLALTGQAMSEEPDIVGPDEGYTSFVRSMFYLQVATTDEAISGSTSQDLNNIVTMSWTPTTRVNYAAYTRVIQSIAYCNEFLRQTSMDKLAERGHDDAAFIAEVEEYQNEVRFLRAFLYWNMCDVWGRGPFITEDDPLSAKFLPEQANRQELFDYAEAELLDLENKLKEPKGNEYARVDKAAAWMTLSRLYLNAEVYTGTPRWADAKTYAEKVINCNAYQLAPRFINNFLADNHTSPEFIWPLAFDGVNSQTYGGSTFLVLCQVGGNMQIFLDFGAEGWGNIRVRPEFVSKFPEADVIYDVDAERNFDLNYNNYKKDKRALVYGYKHSLEIDPLTNVDITNGYASTKFRNLTKDGVFGSAASSVDTDFAIFRLAEAYLNAAEAILRSNGDKSTALGYMNEIRDRAYETGKYGTETPNPLTSEELTLEYILDERSREMAWELTRRIDLIRYGKFTGGDYLWSWKGYQKDGIATDSKYNLFPLPQDDLTANPNLSQNPDYL